MIDCPKCHTPVGPHLERSHGNPITAGTLTRPCPNASCNWWECESCGTYGDDKGRVARG